jgi:hypothetical protein
LSPPPPPPSLPTGQAIILSSAGNASGAAVCVAFAIIVLIAAVVFHLYMKGTINPVDTDCDAMCDRLTDLAGLSAKRAGPGGDDDDEEEEGEEGAGRRRKRREEEEEEEAYDEDGNRLISICGKTYPRRQFLFRVAALVGLLFFIIGCAVGAQGNSGGAAGDSRLVTKRVKLSRGKQREWMLTVCQLLGSAHRHGGGGGHDRALSLDLANILSK